MQNVKEFRKKFQKVDYAFDNSTSAYEYIQLVNKERTNQHQIGGIMQNYSKYLKSPIDISTHDLYNIEESNIAAKKYANGSRFSSKSSSNWKDKNFRR